MLNIVLFGPPGAGKGTQSEKLQKNYGLTHLSTGDLFRKHLSEGTPLGKQAQSFMDAGNLVPDAVVIGMVEEAIDSAEGSKGFIFDGFPRTVPQAEALDQMLNQKDIPVNTMLALEVPDDELKKRLLLRGETSGRTDDQDEAKIYNRIKVYKSETIPVAEFYQAQGKFESVIGVGEIENIFNELCSAINKHL